MRKIWFCTLIWYLRIEIVFPFSVTAFVEIFYITNWNVIVFSNNKSVYQLQMQFIFLFICVIFERHWLPGIDLGFMSQISDLNVWFIIWYHSDWIFVDAVKLSVLIPSHNFFPCIGMLVNLFVYTFFLLLLTYNWLDNYYLFCWIQISGFIELFILSI